MAICNLDNLIYFRNRLATAECNIMMSNGHFQLRTCHTKEYRGNTTHTQTLTYTIMATKNTLGEIFITGACMTH